MKLAPQTTGSQPARQMEALVAMYTASQQTRSGLQSLHPTARGSQQTPGEAMLAANNDTGSNKSATVLLQVLLQLVEYLGRHRTMTSCSMAERSTARVAVGEDLHIGVFVGAYIITNWHVLVAGPSLETRSSQWQRGPANGKAIPASSASASKR